MVDKEVLDSRYRSPSWRASEKRQSLSSIARGRRNRYAVVEMSGSMIRLLQCDAGCGSAQPMFENNLSMGFGLTWACALLAQRIDMLGEPGKPLSEKGMVGAGRKL